MNYKTFCQENILLGLSVGAYAQIADRMSDSEKYEDALSVLRTVWGAEVPRPLKMISTNWSGDKHTFGAYSFPTKLCEPSDFDGLSEGISGDHYKSLFFCGEHTTFDYASSGTASYTAQFQPEHVNIGNLGEEFVNEKQATRQGLLSDIAGKVASRPGLALGAAALAVSQTETGQRVFNGVYNQAKESLRNIGGKTFVVPNNPPPGIAGGAAIEGMLPEE